jgi:hypothetical protein
MNDPDDFSEEKNLYLDSDKRIFLINSYQKSIQINLTNSQHYFFFLTSINYIYEQNKIRFKKNSTNLGVQKISVDVELQN